MAQNTVRNLVIIGAGDFGREVAALVKRINGASSSIRYSILGFIDDNEALLNKEIAGIRVIGDIAWLNEYRDGKLYAVCAIGFGSTRKKVVEKIQNDTVIFPVLIDPAAIFLGDVNIGEGSIICANNVVSVDVVIGRHVIINLSCTIGHDVNLHDYSVVNPGTNLSGFVEIGECTDVGTGTKIIQHIKVRENVVLGAGTVVIDDITEPGTYVGVPARMVKVFK